ncbi:hypothetical protein D3C85_1852600 [compost metagenome]
MRDAVVFDGCECGNSLFAGQACMTNQVVHNQGSDCFAVSNVSCAAGCFIGDPLFLR